MRAFLGTYSFDFFFYLFFFPVSRLVLYCQNLTLFCAQETVNLLTQTVKKKSNGGKRHL